MKNLCTLLLFTAIIFWNSFNLQSQTLLNTTAVSGFSNNNGSGTVTFNFQNTNSYSITITDVEGITGTAGSNTAQVWIKTTPISGSPGAIDGSNGWTLAASGSFVGVANSSSLTTQVFLTGISVVIPGGVTYGMAIFANGQRYHTMVSPNIPLTTVSGGGCNILMGTNISYAGGTPPATPSNSPRAWLGKITFEGKNLRNDAGITMINTPTSPITPGIYNVTATLKNFGFDTLKSVGLRWSVNGINQSSPSNWTGALPQNNTDGPVTFGSYNFSIGNYVINTWTVNPNGSIDSNSKNDTATINIMCCNPLSGTYIIDRNGTGNYLSFNDALYALKNCGVGGPVVFRVKNGAYMENLEIPAIYGVNATNTVTFESYLLDSTAVILTYGATGTADNFVLRFNGANYITFKDITIYATGTSYGRAIEFINAANYNKLLNNVIQTPVTTSSNICPVYSYTTLDQYNTICNNLIIGGYYGIYWYGISTSSMEQGNVIEGNTIRDFYYYGILCYYQNAVKIRRNTLTNSSASGSCYGIYSYYNYNDVDISYNKITIKATSTIYGLYLSSNIATSTLRGKVANNFISSGGTSTGTIYALYLSTVSYHDVSFNTVCINNTSTSGRCLYITGGTASSTTVRNNIFANLGGGYAIYAGSTSSSLGTCNYNNLYTSGANLGYWSANRADLAAWRTASSKDANSVSIAPLFYSSTNDLHLNQSALNGLGTSISGITDDIDGETRLSPPDMGADEFNITNNDAGVSELVSPLFFCPGNIANVSVKVKNFGNSTLTSVTVNWQVNGVTQAPATFSVSLTQLQEATVSLGTFSFNPGTIYNLNFWTSLPNGVTDENTRNDAYIYNNLPALLSGTYTIGGTVGPTNYPTFTSAVADLVAKGICGPVLFNVQKGTYSERIVIPAISGASLINTITFDGNHPDSAKITYVGTSSALATILFNGADYITFKNISIENTGASTAYGVCLMNAADLNTFDNCKILMSTTTSTSTVVGIISTSTETSVTGYANNANYTTVNNCRIIGAYYGIKFNGTSSSVKCIGNKVTNCTLTDGYYYGIYYYYTTNDTISNNFLSGYRYSSWYGIYHYYGGNYEQINNNTVENAYYGIYDYYGNNYGTVSGNRIIGAYYGLYHYGAGSSTPAIGKEIMDNYITSRAYGLYCYYHNGTKYERNYVRAGLYGMYCYYENYSGSDSSTIYNNMISSGGGTYLYGYGLLLSTSGRVKVYQNTMQLDTSYSSLSTSYAACRIQSCSYGWVKVMNNIFRTFGTNMNCFSTDGTGLAAAGSVDYNVYYASIMGSPIASWGTTTYTSFFVWKTAMPLYNKNSQSVDPQLVSKYNQHMSSSATLLKGFRVGIDVDKDRDPRCVPVPTIGADEMTHPYSKPDADFFVDSSVCSNSPYVFYNKAGINDPALHFWFVNGVYKSSDVHFRYLFPTTGIDTVMLVTQNCSTTDTAIKTVNVTLPTTPPVSYFIADKNNVEVFETITLTDYSYNCPENWTWKIIPDTIFDPTVGGLTRTYTFVTGNEHSINPQIAFLYSGKYGVCLTTSNTYATGTPYCVMNYIEVQPTATFCIFPFDTRDSIGTLYDDGGYKNPYSANKSCGLFIHPCASTVFFVFRTFDIYSDDYVRIYDGTDAKGTPLWDASLYPNGLNNSTMIPTPADTFISKSGKMYIDLISNASNQAAGFSGNWFSTHVNYAPPVADFDIPDTICNGIPVIFKNTSTGTQITASWDFDSDGWYDNFDYNGVNTFLWDGDYDVMMSVTSCGGDDSITKHVYVNTPVFPPEFELQASNTRPNIFSENVTVFENTLKNCVDSAIWTITPNKFLLLSGDLKKSTELLVKFNDTVCYDFTVIGSYHGMRDTVYYPCFIKPVLYCNPVATNLSTDIGISRFVMNTIDNKTPIGVTEYSDYSAAMTTNLERGALINFAVSRNTNFNLINRKLWIDLNVDGFFDETNELMASDPPSNSLTWNGTFTLPKSVLPGSYRMRIGTSFSNNPNTPCGPNYFGEFEDYKFNVIDDISKPLITLNGPSTITISECDRAFTDPGAMAWDNVDGNLTDSILITGGFNANLAGTYLITYDVHDAAGNQADQVSRNIVVVRETVPPQVVLIDDAIVNLQVFTPYTDQGFIATDTCSGLDTVEVYNNVDTSNIGNYIVRYTVYDMEGNFTVVTREVNVFDTIAPVISSSSIDTITMNVHSLLAKPVYTTSDNYYKTVEVKIQGTYYQNFPNGEASAIGYYTLIYLAIDGSGNSSSISFVIHVVDEEKPEFLLKGNGMYIICRFDTLDDPGYILKDNYDSKPAVVKSGTYITEYLPKRICGNFDLIYTATDNSGNKSVASRFIVVTDQGSCASSINRENPKGIITLYPNPGSGNFNLAFDVSEKLDVEVSVVNSLGEVVYQSVETITPGKILAFDKQDWKSGIYYILVNLGGEYVSFKYHLVK